MKTVAVSACISEYKTEYKTVRAINVTACAAPLLLEDNRRGYICFKEMPARVSNFRESGIGNFNFAGGHKK